MKLCTFPTVALPLFSPLSAAIIFTEVNDRISRPSTPPFLEYDLNEDGQIDWGLRVATTLFSQTFSVSAPTTTLAVTQSLSPGEVSQDLVVLREGDIIGPIVSPSTSQWSIGNGQLLSGQFDNAWGGPFVREVAYLGFSFESGGEAHYAWALVEGGGPLAHRGVISYARETEPGVAILAGAIPEPSSAGLLIMALLGSTPQRRGQDPGVNQSG